MRLDWQCLRAPPPLCPEATAGGCTALDSARAAVASAASAPATAFERFFERFFDTEEPLVVAMEAVGAAPLQKAHSRHLQ